MKVIISHDVDHLFREDHYRDLFFLKNDVRTLLKLLTRNCTARECWLRIISPFKKKQNNIAELAEFDMKHGINSTFFFGMSNGLGMSYDCEKVAPYVKKLYSWGFDVGVHGIAFNDIKLMKNEKNKFMAINGRSPIGIRMHYVRFDDSTFKALSNLGYTYDSTEFDKNSGYLIKSPYKVNNMWEFPLTIMEGYLNEKPLTENLEHMKKRTLEIIKLAKDKNVNYITILFHDYMFTNMYSCYKSWYEWLIDYLCKNDFDIISFTDAIGELNDERE